MKVYDILHDDRSQSGVSFEYGVICEKNLNPRTKGDWMLKIGGLCTFLKKCLLKVSGFIHYGRS